MKDGLAMLIVLFLGIVIGFLYCFVWMKVREQKEDDGIMKNTCSCTNLYTCPMCGKVNKMHGVVIQTHVYKCSRCGYSNKTKE